MIILLPTKHLQFGGAAHSKMPMIHAPTPQPFNPASYVIGFRKANKECTKKIHLLNKEIDKLKKENQVHGKHNPYIKNIKLSTLSKDILRDLVLKEKKLGHSTMEKVSYATKQQLYNELKTLGYKE